MDVTEELMLAEIENGLNESGVCVLRLFQSAFPCLTPILNTCLSLS